VNRRPAGGLLVALALALALVALALGLVVGLAVAGGPAPSAVGVTTLATRTRAITASVKRPSSARLNPPDERPRPGVEDDASWRPQVERRRLGLFGARAEATLRRGLWSTERSALDAAVHEAAAHCSVPVLSVVVEAMLDPKCRESSLVRHAASSSGGEP
jgi:hypothetical protein